MIDSPRSGDAPAVRIKDFWLAVAGSLVLSKLRTRQRERSLFEVLLPGGHKLWPDWLRRIDTLLEDESVIEVVEHALEQRWPRSRRRGRPGTPAEIVIRMLILKHLFDWS